MVGPLELTLGRGEMWSVLSCPFARQFVLYVEGKQLDLQYSRKPSLGKIEAVQVVFYAHWRKEERNEWSTYCQMKAFYGNPRHCHAVFTLALLPPLQVSNGLYETVHSHHMFH